MAWLEHREGHVRVVWRDPDTGGKTYEKFATDAEADIYRDLVERARGRRPETLYKEPATGGRETMSACASTPSSSRTTVWFPVAGPVTSSSARPARSG